MIEAVFQQKKGEMRGFTVSGHSGYAPSGEDIVCAAVSSAVELAANLITEQFREDAQVEARGETVSCVLRVPGGAGSQITEGLCAHLRSIGEEFPGTVHITIAEV